jgi:outer membrane receptor protein involved in Fe transport
MKCTFLIVAGSVALVFTPWSARAEDIVIEPIEVVAKKLNEARNSIMPETGSSIYRLNQDDIGGMPQGDATPLNQVLLRAPGVAQDSFGQLHVRGDHANLQYRVNDVIIPESIAGFGQTLDPRFFGEVNFLTGALPAQYGYRTAGVVDIHTKSGIQAPGGSVGLQGGSYDTVNPSIEYGGLGGRTDYYVTAQYLHSAIGIENPTADRTAIHDNTNQWKGFGYFSHLLNDTSRISVLLGSSFSNFQIPNSPGHTPNFALDGGATPTPFDSTALNENQRETTQYGILAFQGKGGTDLDYQLALFSRYSQLHFRPDPIGDLVFNGVASDVYRSSFSNGLQGDSSFKLNPEHTLRSGVFYSREFAVTNNSSAVFNADPTGAQLAGQGPVSITDNNNTIAFLYGAYLQDEWRLTDKFTLNYGARYDYSDSFVKEGQLSPRLGAVYKLTPTTNLHAGYARYFTPPPTELVAPKTLALFQNTTNAPQNNVNDPVKSERADYFDLGIIQKVTPEWTVGLDGYYKKAHHLIDEGQFGNALVFTPFNYEEAKVYGIEWTNSYHKDNFGAYLNVALARAMGKNIESAQFNFSQADLDYIATHYIHLDHDQRITASGGVSYVWQQTTYAADVLFGTGLRRTTGDVPNGDHVPGYATVNLGASRPFMILGVGEITGRVAVLNVFDRTYEIRDGTGIGVGAPQFGMRRAFFAGATKSF